MINKLLILILFLMSGTVCAGAYEDLEEALIRGSASDAIALIKRGLDINTVDRSGNTLLMQAIRRDLPDFADFLVRNRARLNTRNQNGETALSIAAFTGKMGYVERLVQAGADINTFGWSPLIYAAFSGHAEIAGYLLKHGAEVDVKAPNEATALIFAARFGHIEIVKMLLEAKADPNAADDRGLTAIDWALKSANTDSADLIRAAGGRPSQSVVIELK